MTTSDDPKKAALVDNPGLEHEHATPEGEPMTAAGSTIREPHETDDNVPLDDRPGLEHDEATAAGRMMTAGGSTGPESGDPHTVESKFERKEEYQAPPRDPQSAAVGTRSVPDVDVNVLESQEKPSSRTSETIVTDLEKTTYTISGKDEEADPEDPRATPPGETM